MEYSFSVDLISGNHSVRKRSPCAFNVISELPVIDSVKPRNPLMAALLAMRMDRKEATPKARMATKMVS